MRAYFEWLQALPISMWVSGSDSIWSFPFILFVHTVGIALSGGCAFVITLGFLGRLASPPMSRLRKLLPWFWIGFGLNIVSGTLLFMAAATTTGYSAMYYTKLALILVGIVTFLPLSAFARRSADERSDIPARLKALAVASLIAWTAVIATGRLIAYIK